MTQKEIPSSHVSETGGQIAGSEVELLPVLKHFQSRIDLSHIGIRPINQGLISSVFVITPEQKQLPKLVLRQINPIYDFNAVNQNLVLFQNAQEQMKPKLPSYWQPLVFYPVAGNQNMVYTDSEGKGWMTMEYIPGEIAIFDSFREIPEESRLDSAYSLGRAVSTMDQILNTIPAQEWASPLPNHHNLPYHLNYLNEIIRENQIPLSLTRNPSILVSRDNDIYREYQVIFDYLIHEVLDRSQRYTASDHSRKAIQWNDLKISNTVFRQIDGVWQCVGLIDPDSMQLEPGLNDIADALRSAGNPAGEQPASLSDVKVDIQTVNSIINGYLSSVREDSGGADEDEIRKNIYNAYAVFLYRLVIRFLADALIGNKYFKLKAGESDTLNLYRAQVQFRALQMLEEKHQSGEI